MSGKQKVKTVTCHHISTWFSWDVLLFYHSRNCNRYSKNPGIDGRNPVAQRYFVPLFTWIFIHPFLVVIGSFHFPFILQLLQFDPSPKSHQRWENPLLVLSVSQKIGLKSSIPPSLSGEYRIFLQQYFWV